jgi:hypothetical protein
VTRSTRGQHALAFALTTALVLVALSVVAARCEEPRKAPRVLFYGGSAAADELTTAWARSRGAVEVGSVRDTGLRVSVKAAMVPALVAMDGQLSKREGTWARVGRYALRGVGLGWLACSFRNAENARRLR